MALSQVRNAKRVQQPIERPRQKTDSFGNLLGIAQGVGGVLAATGNPLGAGISAGAGLLGAIRDKPKAAVQQAPRQQQRTGPVQRIDTGAAISRRMDLAQTDPVADLLQAQQALQQLPEEQRRQFEKPIGLAIAEQKRRFS